MDIKNYYGSGPSFGDRELMSIDFQPMNNYRAWISITGKKNYNISFEGGKNMLTNLDFELFTITELEVWKLDI